MKMELWIWMVRNMQDGLCPWPCMHAVWFGVSTWWWCGLLTSLRTNYIQLSVCIWCQVDKMHADHSWLITQVKSSDLQLDIEPGITLLGAWNVFKQQSYIFWFLSMSFFNFLNSCFTSELEFFDSLDYVILSCWVHISVHGEPSLGNNIQLILYNELSRI